MDTAYVIASRSVSWRSLPTWRSMKSCSAGGTSRSSKPSRRNTSRATACETSSERLVSGLNIITRSGSQCWPGHQIGDGGLIDCPVEIGFRERRTEKRVHLLSEVLDLQGQHSAAAGELRYRRARN